MNKLAVAIVLVLACASVGRADIISTAQSANLTSLLAAAQAAGLASALPTFKTGTIFAPTNAAFAELLKVLNATSVNQIPKAVLTEVLQYHVSTTPYKSTDLKNNQEISTLLSGATIQVSLDGGKVKLIPEDPSVVGPATVVKADVPVNGTSLIVHVIDKVLVPLL